MGLVHLLFYLFFIRERIVDKIIRLTLVFIDFIDLLIYDKKKYGIIFMKNKKENRK